MLRVLIIVLVLVMSALSIFSMLLRSPLSMELIFMSFVMGVATTAIISVVSKLRNIE